MCGIAGIVHESHSIFEETVIQMRDVMQHRGPDSADYRIWQDNGIALIHLRLSIIDLSEAGRNPLSNEDGSIWITYNGEVYNYRALRQELEQLGHCFRSDTDTEVIVHAYEEWGDEHVNRLRGMFAYAIYDARPNISPAGFRLLLVRDRVGIKPLNYYFYQGLLVFASEIKSILAHPQVNQAIDETAIFDYLTYLYIPQPKTAYQHIRSLLPGHMLSFDGEKISIQEYWDVPVSAKPPINSESEAIEFVGNALRDATRAHLVSDVPVGVFLSGGVDSSSVLALMAGLVDTPPHTFSIDFDVSTHSEIHYARMMASRYHTTHHEQVVSDDSVQNLLEHMLHLYDEPFADHSGIPTWIVSKLASEHVKVVLSGDGGDEVFVGYSWYDRWLRLQQLRANIPHLIRKHIIQKIGLLWSPKARGNKYKRYLEDFAYDPIHQYARQLEIFSPEEKRRLVGTSNFDGYDDYWYFKKYWRDDLSPVTRMQYLDLKTYLVSDILTKVDRATMGASLEARPPLLDHLLIEAVMQVSPDILYKNNQKKYLLKQIMKDKIPDAILQRPKKGFSTPMVKWIQRDPSYVNQQLKHSAYFQQSNILEELSNHQWGAKRWSLLMLEAWKKQ